jgi:azurin
MMFITACGGDKTATISIKPVGNEMKFDTTRFEVKAGQEVRLIMDNIATIDMMKHNIVILNDSDAISAVGQAAVSAPGYLPDHPAIVAATPMADAGQKTEVTFNAPKTPGEYPFICTFPGHYLMMQGIMVVK